MRGSDERRLECGRERWIERAEGDGARAEAAGDGRRGRRRRRRAARRKMRVVMKAAACDNRGQIVGEDDQSVKRKMSPMGLDATRRRGRLTSGTPRRRGTSPGGAQSVCMACARAARARRAVSGVVALARASVRLWRAAGRPSRRRGSAGGWRGERKTQRQVRAHRVA